MQSNKQVNKQTSKQTTKRERRIKKASQKQKQQKAGAKPNKNKTHTEIATSIDPVFFSSTRVNNCENLSVKKSHRT